MMDGRIKNTIRNIKAGLLSRVFSFALPFVSRTVLIYTLGIEYTGLSSLFTSILSVLNIASLGFNQAIIYAMYEPVAYNDFERINRLLTLYRKVYRVAGTLILTVGVLLMPLLPSLISGDVPRDVNLYVIYIMYLMDSVLSYFLFAYRESILLAYQRKDISQMVRTGVIVMRNVIQIIVLLLSRNYYLYFGISLVGTVVTNIALAVAAKCKFPLCHCVKERGIRIPNEMKKQVGGLLVNNISIQTRNSFDSIFLSKFMGLTAVGIYNNYYNIYNALYMIIIMLSGSMSAGVGNSIVKESQERNYRNLIDFSFLMAMLSGWMSICMLCIYQPFMCIWVGRDLLLSNLDMFLFCVYFYTISASIIVSQYISGTGIWWKLKVVYIFQAAVNIILNFFLGKVIGVTGIILATIITCCAFDFLAATKVLFRNYFKGMDIKKYFVKHLKWMATTGVTAGLCYLICQQHSLKGWGEMAANLIICTVVPMCIWSVIYWRTEESRFAKSLIKKIMRGREDET